MARKLKTYVATSGFFELAVAAPSMKAAVEIWGAGPDLFQRGYAKGGKGKRSGFRIISYFAAQDVPVFTFHVAASRYPSFTIVHASSPDTSGSTARAH